MEGLTWGSKLLLMDYHYWIDRDHPELIKGKNVFSAV
jgi:hypothetical protein